MRARFASVANDEIHVRRRRDALPPPGARLLNGLLERDAETKAIREFTATRLAWQDAIVLDDRLTTAERLVGVFIAGHIDRRRGLAFFSQQYAARMLGFKTERSIERAVMSLVGLDWIHAIQPNRRETIKYMLLLNNIERIQDHRQAVREKLQEQREAHP